MNYSKIAILLYFCFRVVSGYTQVLERSGEFKIDAGSIPISKYTAYYFGEPNGYIKTS